MTRSWLAVLTCFAFSGLSCSIFAPRTQPDSLPAVSAEPPASASNSALREAEIASVTRALAARATGLTVRMAGIARRDGRLGETIPVQNISSGEVREAIVRSAKSVEVLIR